jgi:teichuronic acid biosynthesis glycosyltransferase TuaC
MLSSSPMQAADAASGRSLHVVTLTPFFPFAGNDASGCFISEPLPHLQRAGVRSTVLAVRPIYRGRVQACAGAPPATWVHYLAPPRGIGLAFAGRFLFARLVSRIRRLHASDPIDLIHAHTPLPCGHAAALLSRELAIPFVVSVHGLDAYSTNQVKGIGARWCRRTSQMVYRSARRIICISERVREEVKRGADAPVDCAVIYNGADPEFFRPTEKLADDGPTVLSIGNLIDIKGHDVLLRALGAVQAYPKLRCEIVGEGPERPRLERLTADLGIADRVAFLGRQSRKSVAEALARCAIFALPSRYEGLGCVYLEAMSAAKPVIACRAQGIGEVIRSGENGWLVGADNVPELANALTTLLDDPELRSALGHAARRTVLEGFTLAHQAERLAHVFRECAG